MGTELSGKVAIVTGGARGLGRATVELFTGTLVPAGGGTVAGLPVRQVLLDQIRTKDAGAGWPPVQAADGRHAGTSPFRTAASTSPMTQVIAPTAWAWSIDQPSTRRS